jgi:hypothetical protein
MNSCTPLVGNSRRTHYLHYRGRTAKQRAIDQEMVESDPKFVGMNVGMGKFELLNHYLIQ